MDVGANPAVSEVLVKGLAWNLQNVASSIQSSEKAVFYSSPGEFRPESARLIKISCSDSSRWLNLETLQMALTLHNDDPVNPMELLVSGMGLFDNYRVLSQGTTIYESTDVARLTTTLDALQGTTARTYKAEKALPLVHGNLNEFVPNGDGRLWLHSGNGFNGADGTDEKMFNSATAVRLIISDIECERFVCLAPGNPEL